MNGLEVPPSPFDVACRYCGSAPYYKCRNAITGQAMRKIIAHPCRFIDAARRRSVEVLEIIHG